MPKDLDTRIERWSERGSITLEFLAEHGADLSYEEIDYVVGRLEAMGLEVAVDASSPLENLRVTLPAIRGFVARTGRKPTVVELSTETGLGEDAVRSALFFSRILSRSR